MERFLLIYNIIHTWLQKFLMISHESWGLMTIQWLNAHAFVFHRFSSLYYFPKYVQHIPLQHSKNNNILGKNLFISPFLRMLHTKVRIMSKFFLFIHLSRRFILLQDCSKWYGNDLSFVGFYILSCCKMDMAWYIKHSKSWIF